MFNVLVCDDERTIVSALKIYLSAEDFGVLEAYTGKEAISIVEKDADSIHLILMDIMMPEMDGISAMKIIREKYNMPIILLTAKSQDSDKINGLETGADDYITKPFNPVEVVARVKSHLRRYTQLGSREKAEADSLIRVGGIEIDDKKRSVAVDGRLIALTNTEFEILKLFALNPGQIFSTKDIYRSVWKTEPYGEENTIAVHIRHIREKIEINPADPRYIKVVWAQGYKMEEMPLK